MTFSPVRKSKHVGIKTECACGVVHDSRKEWSRCVYLRHLQDKGEIVGLRTHPRYDFYINGRQVLMENRHCAHITLDFAYFEMPYELAVVEDVKPKSKKADSRDYPLRKAIFKALYPHIELREIR